MREHIYGRIVNACPNLMAMGLVIADRLAQAAQTLCRPDRRSLACALSLANFES